MELYIYSTTGGELKNFLPNVKTDLNLFYSWFNPNEFTALDIETNMVDSILDRRIVTIALYRDNVSWVIFFDEVEDQQKLIQTINTGKYIIQSAKFEYKVFKKHGIMLNRFFDTLLAEKLLNMGLDGKLNDLTTLLKRYLGVIIDKTLQTSFDKCITITDDQLNYIVKDVLYLHEIKDAQEKRIKDHDAILRTKFKSRKNRGLKKTNWWNNEFVKVLGDSEYAGAKLDVDTWMKLYEEALPKVKTAETLLDKIVYDDFYMRAVAANFIYEEDTLTDKLYSSSKKKTTMLQIIYPDIEKTSQLELAKYLQQNDPNWPEELKPTSKKVAIYIKVLYQDKYTPIKLLLQKREEDFSKVMLVNFKTEMLKHKLLIPKGTIDINWASPVQRMQIFRWIDPGLQSTDKDHVEEVAYKHRLLQEYLDKYQHYIGLVTKFGLNYIKHVEADGRVRTNFNPIINTGRISSSKPNMLNLTNDKRYRACFIAEKGWKYVMTDFQSQEMTLMAIFAKQQNWLDAIRKGHDIHSLNASVMLKKDWDEAEEIDCKFAKTKRKCNCKKHKELRSAAKSTNFGSLYGISKFGLAFQLKTDVDTAQDLLDSFFKTVPQIKKFKDSIGKFAIRNLYSPEFVLGACRFVDKRKLHYDKNSILRTSGNFSAQGAAASILKIAGVLIRRHSLHNNKPVKFITLPYDELVVEVPEQDSEYWKEKLQYFMELAGKLALNDDILKTDPAKIADYWIH